MGGGGGAAAAAVVGAGEVRHWECCVKRVEGSESQTKEAAATFSAPPPPPPLADRPSSGATGKKKNKTQDLQHSTGKRDPPPLACGPDTGDRNTYFWVALLYCFFSLGKTRRGEFPASRSGFVSPSTSRCYSAVLAGLRGSVFFFFFGRGSGGGGGGGGGAGDRSQNKGVFGWSGGMSEPRLALPFAFLKAGQMPL